MLVASPLVASQVRNAMSWVFPNCGDESVLPARSAGKFPSATVLLTTSPAPPDAAPATIRTLPLVLIKALIAGPGPTNAASSVPPRSASLSAGPALNVVVLTVVPLGIAPWKNPLDTPMSAGAWVRLTRYPRLTVDGSVCPVAPVAAVADPHAPSTAAAASSATDVAARR